jgi:glycosyltransferase involved in cell wall biosynthesis
MGSLPQTRSTGRVTSVTILEFVLENPMSSTSTGATASGPLIAVGLPSLNEARTIRDVTSQFDQGLSLVRGAESVLVNIDSGSTDGTVEIFNATPTVHARVSLVERGQPPGKGHNLLRFFRHGLEHGADAFVVADTDLRSAEPGWVPRLAGPVLEGSADFVTPFFRRSRFRCVLTWGIAHPLLFAWFGADLRQPIGATAALSRRLVERILTVEPDSAMCRWGIDLGLSARAAASGLPWAEAELKRCDDEANWRHIPDIAYDVCATAVRVAREYPRQARGACEAPARPGTFEEETEYPDPDDVLAAYGTEREQALRYRAEYARWLPRNCQPRIDQVLAADTPTLDTPLWAELVAGMLLDATTHRPDLPAAHFAEAIVPLLGIRKLTTWTTYRNLPAAEIDREAALGATLLRRALDGRMP